MSRIFKPIFEGIDERGVLREIVSQGEWRSVNLAFRKSGSVLGGHYHKKREEIIFLISGKAHVTIENVNTSQTEEFYVNENEGFIVRPHEKHTLKVISDLSLLELLSEKFDKNTPDTFR